MSFAQQTTTALCTIRSPCSSLCNHAHCLYAEQATTSSSKNVASDASHVDRHVHARDIISQGLPACATTTAALDRAHRQKQTCS